MCGILGVVDSVSPVHLNQHELASLLSRLSHRGPDASGICNGSQFAFGHTRLSVIDLDSSANQPMFDNQERICITYNGEIYNYLELKDTLLKNGHTFNTKSDTEVILESYKAWGIDGIKKLNGMFAFGIFDIEREEFYLVRDHIGVKPVYYALTDSLLTFSSEIKGIINSPKFKKSINFSAISSFMSFRQPINGETFFENVYLLPPGHYLKYYQGKISIIKYWGINPKKKDLFFSKKKYLKRLIHDSVKMTTVGDVPITCFLSGGIDSSVILHEISNIMHTKITTFTVTFKEDAYNELYYAKMVANKYHSHNIEIKINAEDYFKDIQELIRYKDQPLGMHNEVALYLMAKKVKEYSKVALSGEGSDEIFGGYGRIFRLYFDYYRGKIVRRFPTFLRRILIKNLNLNEANFNKTQSDFFLSHYEYFPSDEKYEIFNQEMKSKLNEDLPIKEYFRNLFERYSGSSFRDKILYVFQEFHLPGLLVMMDTASMAAGLEVRFPFTDHRLIEEVVNIPFRYKLRWKSIFSLISSVFLPVVTFSENKDITKYLLKQLYSNDLPDEIVNRKKMVFPVPLKEWFENSKFSTFVRNEVLGKNSKSSLFFDLEKLEAWINRKEKSNDSMYGRKIWLILNIEYWLREYFP